jgi:uncharacterized membrane protein YGL010W
MMLVGRQSIGKSRLEWLFCGLSVRDRWSSVLGMLGGRSWESWIAEYADSHQHPLNRLTHTFGIPIIMISLPVLLAGVVWHRLLWVGLGLFCFGWALQFVGHAIEGKPPEFLKDWRFLLVGSRWWAAKMRGKA